jgi:hypothetical protein
MATNRGRAPHGQPQHTPGPWTVEYEGDSVARVLALCPQGEGGIHTHQHPLAKVEWFSPESTKTNARLIAAAPELLTMLRRLNAEIRMTECGMSHVAALTLEQVSAALRRAEGEEA